MSGPSFFNAPSTRPGAYLPPTAMARIRLENSPFAGVVSSRIGLEIEGWCVRLGNGLLVPIAQKVIDAFAHDPASQDRFHPELHAVMLEVVNGGEHYTVGSAVEDLQESVLRAQACLSNDGARLLFMGIPPLGNPRRVQLSDNARVRQLVTIPEMTNVLTGGLHLHGQVSSGDRAIEVINHLLRHGSLFQGMTNSSPWWIGVDTGLESARTPIFGRLPLTGPPPPMVRWEEYLQFLDGRVTLPLSEGGIMEGTVDKPWTLLKDLHHDARGTDKGTVELRICDVPTTLREVGAVAALFQCLVREVEDGGVDPNLLRPLTNGPLHANRNLAARDGMRGWMWTAVDGEGDLVLRPVRTVLAETVERLRPIARQLGCSAELDDVLVIANEWGSVSERARALYENSAGLPPHIHLRDRSAGSPFLQRGHVQAVMSELARETSTNAPAIKVGATPTVSPPPVGLIEPGPATASRVAAPHFQISGFTQ